MKKIVSCLIVAAFALATPALFAQDTLRPEVAKPAQAGLDLLKAGKFAEALAKVTEAEAVPNRTPYENFVLDQIRGSAAAGSGDSATAIRSYEAALAAQRMPPAEALPIMEGLAGAAYKLKDYERTVTWARRYYAEGGTNPQLRRLLATALYQRFDWAGSAAELGRIVADDEAANRRPGEDLLRLLGSSQAKQNEMAGYRLTLEKLLRWYPKPAYWRDRVGQLQRDPAFDPALLVDSYRLLFATGSFDSTNEYVASAELALRANLPTEAQKLVDAGYAAGKLGSGADAAAHDELRQRASRGAADDAKEFDKNLPPSPGASANVLVSQGLALATAGRTERGVALIEQGLAKGGGQQPDAARLRLGWVLATAGRAEPARAVFKDLQAKGGSIGELARLWLIQLDKPAS